MFNSLAYPLPTEYENYEVDLSFDNVLRMIDLLNDNEVDEITRIEIATEMLFDSDLSDLTLIEQRELFESAFKELVQKERERTIEVDRLGNPMPKKKTEDGEEERVLSFSQDAEFIFSSFYQDYGIDLFEQQGKLHWYKFLALLDGLKKDTRLKEVIEIRTMELPTGKHSGKHREQVKKAKEHYRLKPE